MIGRLAGVALGSLVEFEPTERIRRMFPGGLRELADGGTFDTIAGQPTDDSEMALMPAQTLVERGTYDAEAALEAYKYWFDSHPFDYGGTVAAAHGDRCLNCRLHRRNLIHDRQQEKTRLERPQAASCRS